MRRERVGTRLVVLAGNAPSPGYDTLPGACGPPFEVEADGTGGRCSLGGRLITRDGDGAAPDEGRWPSIFGPIAPRVAERSLSRLWKPSDSSHESTFQVRIPTPEITRTTAEDLVLTVQASTRSMRTAGERFSSQPCWTP